MTRIWRWTAAKTVTAAIGKLPAGAFNFAKGRLYSVGSGMGQAEDIMRIFSAQGLETVAVIPDLAGINRCVILKK